MPGHRTNLGTGTTAQVGVVDVGLLMTAISAVMPKILCSVVDTLLEIRG
jgi:hypothetical protein